MTFSSPIFLFAFFPPVLLLYFLIPAKCIRLRNLWLTFASLVFYGFGEPTAMLLMLLVVAWTWGCTLLSEKSMRLRKWFLPLGILGDLGVLCVYKYADFITETVNALSGASLRSPELRLPIGISFFTFQAISYLIDVSRAQAKAQKSYLRLLLYIAFFPQLIAGPIVRYQTVAEALTSRKSTPEGVASGLRRMIFGLSKKLLIADTLGLLADNAFGAAETPGMLPAWLGAFCYTMQIFYDFSGYSDMAIGMGRIFGFTFPENFRSPYCAAGITEFWRRWHISLTTWFRQYLYIPLGGNRKGKARTVCNRWIVFLCTGLWHGASWTFVLWGILHGAMMTAERAVLSRGGRERRPGKAAVLYTFPAVLLAFVMFRAETVRQAFSYYAAMFSFHTLTAGNLHLFLRPLTPLVLVTLACACIFATPLPERAVGKAEAKAKDAVRITLSVLALALLALCVMNAAATSYHPFIYFRF